MPFEQSGVVAFRIDGADRDFRFTVSATDDSLSVRLQDAVSQHEWQAGASAAELPIGLESPESAAAHTSPTDYAQRIALGFMPPSGGSHVPLRYLSRPASDGTRTLRVGFSGQMSGSSVAIQYIITLQAVGPEPVADPLQESQRQAEVEIETLKREKQMLEDRVNELSQANEHIRASLAQASQRDEETTNEILSLRAQLAALTQENDTLGGICKHQHDQIGVLQSYGQFEVREPQRHFDHGGPALVTPVPRATARNPRVFFDFSKNGQHIGRMVFELFADCVPRTVENFRALCTGEKGVGGKRARLDYKNSTIYEIMEDFGCKGGDFVNNNGQSGDSIYGTTFKDENFVVEHDRRGLLSMVNRGPDSNNSNFRISFKATPWLDGICVAFGEIVSGHAVLDKIQALETRSGRPKGEAKVVIEDCGEIQ